MIDGRKVKALADERGWNQTELAKRSGVSLPRVSEIMRSGKVVNCYIGTVEKIAAALNVDPNILRPTMSIEDPESLEIADLYRRLKQRHSKNTVRALLISLAELERGESLPIGKAFQQTVESGRIAS